MEAALILKILNMIQAGLQWLEHRGVARNSALSLLDLANREGRDVTSIEVQAELDLTQSELDETRRLIGDDT